MTLDSEEPDQASRARGEPRTRPYYLIPVTCHIQVASKAGNRISCMDRGAAGPPTGVDGWTMMALYKDTRTRSRIQRKRKKVVLEKGRLFPSDPVPPLSQPPLRQFETMDAVPLSVSVLGVVLVVYLVERAVNAVKNGRRPPLPPGPRGLPIIGNVNDLPKPSEFEAQHWLKHKELYGPISSVTTMGQTLVIVNDARLAYELLDVRSAKHSSRPSQVMTGEMVGFKYLLGGLPYGEQFRAQRKDVSRVLGTKAAAAKYNTLQEAEVGHFLLHLLDDPDNLAEHIR
ncbi:O-methylsterigmatocystin oxidoreductase, partial [Colletotrichum tanaceti]